MTTKHTKKRLLTFDETCEFLNVKETHLRSLVFKQKIPYRKVGHLLRFDIDEIIEWSKLNLLDDGEVR